MDGRPSKKRRLSPPSETLANGSGSEASFDFDTEANHSSQRQNGSAASLTNGSLSQTNSADEDKSCVSDSGDGDSDGSAEEPLSEEDSHPLPDSLRSTFQMQCDELVDNISPQHITEERRVQKLIATIKRVLEQAPAHKPLPVAQATSRFSRSHKVKIPFSRPRPSGEAKYQLGYSKPVDTTVVGSHALRTSVTLEKKRYVDLAVAMPPDLFSEKDYLNHRYFHKRSYYLACIAAAIENSHEIDCKLFYEFEHGNQLKPVLRLQMSKDDQDFEVKLEVRVILAFPENTFPGQKLLPHRNCVRPKDRDDKEDTQLPPTPFYNASIRSDASIIALQSLCQTARSTCPGYRKACLLGRVWLRQRGFSSSIQGGGIGNFEWSAMLALFLLRNIGADTRPLLMQSYSSVQLFRALLQFLFNRNLVNRPLILGATMKELTSPDGGPILLDAANSFNLLFKMSPWSYDLLRWEAYATTKNLQSKSAGQFDETFIVKVDDQLMRFDFLFRMPLKQLGLLKSVDVEDGLREKTNRVLEVLSKGLGNRVKSIVPILPPSKPWNLQVEPPTMFGDGFMTIGVTGDVANIFRTVDRGPYAEEKAEGEEFRKFWGQKSELRRFKDGQIQEAVVWTSSRPLDLFQEIVTFLMRTHFVEQAGQTVQAVDPNLEYVWPGFNPSSGSLEAPQEQYKSLERDLRRLEGLPLHISRIRPAHPLLSCDAIEDNYPHSRKSADVVIDFEGSARWPEDLTAIQMTKIAFLVRVGELLEQSVPTVRARVGLENETSNVVYNAFLEVQYASSDISFHLRIHHEHEKRLTDGLLNSKFISPAERQVAAAALAYNKRTFEKRPIHTQAMQIMCARHPMLSPTIRLTKRWFNTQLLGLYFPAELIEIFVVRSFIHHQPWLSPPSSPVTGLFRTLLFLSMWDWQTDPLVVDFSLAMTSEDHKAINTRFDAWRKLDPHLNRVAMFVATNFDGDGSTWTEFRPSKTITARMTALAKAAVNAVRSRGLDLRLGVLFKPSLKDYDFVIHLQSHFVPGNRTASKSKYKNLRQSSASGASIDGSDRETIVHGYIAELQSLYGNDDGDPTMMLFYDTARGRYIAGVWGPHASTTNGKKWKINLGCSTVPTSKTSAEAQHNGNEDRQEQEQDNLQARYVVNKPAILAEAARLGSDMIQSVQVLKADDTAWLA
ncbi:MAG: hypothetical protein M1831_000508 [Alyxoria varia]|nr:MAG: hypothetical protein M1831_000508 [Alyxoria varia]